MTKKQKKMLVRIFVSAILLLALHFGSPYLPGTGMLHIGICLILYLIPYYIIGNDILSKAWKGIQNHRPFDECFLMSVATIGAFVIAVVTKSGDFDEAVAVMLFYQIGEWFQGYAVGKSRRNITDLMDIRPDYANVEVDGELEQVDPDEVEVGTVIVVQPGEKIPIDGVVLEGRSSLNTAALTGESVPRDVHEGDPVISGSINMTGVLKVTTTTEFGESTVSKILDLVENASSLKSRSEEFISKFARIYTPAVVYSALALAIVPPAVILLGKLGYEGSLVDMWLNWVYRALTFLVISCPCALVISIPLSFFAGIGGASAQGVLVKGSNYLETLSNATTVVFDKTGTLTEGVFEVAGVHHSPMEDKEVLRLAAHAESASSHPIAKSILKAYGETVDRTIVSDIQELSGHGITAVVEGKRVAVGNEKLMVLEQVDSKPCEEVGTLVHVAVDGVYAGHILIADRIKENSAEAIRRLKKSGVAKTIMLTGDASRIAEAVAEKVGVDEVYAELLPADKVAKVEELLKNRKDGECVVFVGDGINDAPVLMRADIGIAMGAMGSDAAIEAADVVLMDDDPLKISKAIRISRKCLSIVKQNIWFAIVVKLVCLALGALGIASMWIAIIADVGVMVLAVLNAIRALFVKNL